jgi:DNA modification methylase
MLPPPNYTTNLGAAYLGDSLELLSKIPSGSVNLVLTSPPFALQREKEYGNKEQKEYVDWLLQFGRLVWEKLSDDGSFVLDLGGAYEKGIPSRSLYNFRALIRLCDEVKFKLAEDFYWHNPSKLPSPIEWVNKRKLRAKDSVNTVWWLSKTDWPKANVSNVLAPYSDRMKKLISDPDAFFKAKKRPSGHDIGMTFGKDNGGAIPSNLLQIPNSESNGRYLSGCATVGVKPHPARFPVKLPEFFIKFLTDPGDLVVDIFAGSNTTGQAAEELSRRWIAFEMEATYLAGSAFRFFEGDMSAAELHYVYEQILSGKSVSLSSHRKQPILFESAAAYEADKPKRSKRARSRDRLSA